MKSGNRILWTDNALKELEETIKFLEENWKNKELIRLSNSNEKTLSLISQNPFLFQASDSKPEIRRVIILSLNSIYYKISEYDVEILSFFSNRQNPENRKLK